MLRSDSRVVRLVRLVLAGLALAAVATQFTHEVTLPGFSAVNFFSYFTILSNIAAGVTLVGLALVPVPRRTGAVEGLRGALTVYLATTGLVFALLLADGDPGLTLPWVNNVTHRVMPLALLLDWLLVRQRGQVRYSRALLWLAAPIAYLGYSFARGAVVGWYPYPFLRPELVGGVDGVVVRLGVMAVCVAVGSLLVAWFGNARARGAHVRAPAPVAHGHDGGRE